MLNSADIALKIKGLLKSRNISASKLLADCGLNKNALAIWQSSEYAPRLEAITAIADYLGCSVDYLLGRTDNHPRPPTRKTYTAGTEADFLRRTCSPDHPNSGRHRHYRSKIDFHQICSGKRIQIYVNRALRNTDKFEHIRRSRHMGHDLCKMDVPA